MVSVESNLYVSSFMPGVKKDLGLLSELEGEITQERSFWLNSGAAEAMARMHFQAHGLKPEQLPARKFMEQVGLEQSAMFGSIDLQSVFTPQINKMFGQLPAQIRNVYAEIESLETYHRDNYQKAVKPLVDQRRGVESRVYAQWLDYMDGLGPVQDFSQFLADDQFLLLREQQRPFLQLLSRRLLPAGRNSPVNLNNLLGPRVVESAVSNPAPEVFEDFLGNLSSQKQSKALEVMWQWLRLVSFPTEGVDQAKVFEQIALSGIFPADLRGHFTTFIQGRLSPYFVTITGCLGDYKTADTPQPTYSIGIKVRVNKHRYKGDMAQEMNAPVVNFNEDELPVKPTYELVIGDKMDISQEDLDSFAKREAEKLDPHDERMRNDVTRMIEAIWQDPFGFGVSKLTGKVTPSLDGIRKLPLRRFRADRRPLLTLEHPYSRAVRVVYHTENIDGKNLVVIHNVLNHRDFDRIYTG